MAKMTATERMIAVAMGKEPDRVPVTFIGDVSWSWAQLYGQDSFLDFGYDAKKQAEVMIWACKELGLDTVCALSDTMIIYEAIADASGLPYPLMRWKNYVTAPYELYKGDPLKEMMYGNPLIKTKKDAEKLVPADPYKHGRLPIILEAIDLASKELKEDWPIGGWYDFPLIVGNNLMGWTQAFIAMEKDPEFWQMVEDVVIKTCYEFVKAQIKHGVKSLSSGTELSLWVAPQSYLKHPVWMHADHPPELMERIFNEFHMGTSLHPCSVGPFEPGIEIWKGWLDHTPAFLMPECGGEDALARAKDQLVPAVIAGNIHPIDIMLHGTPAEVEESCKKLIKKCAPGGRFILSAGCCLDVKVPMENVKAVIDSAEKYGQYPINVQVL